MGTQVQNVRTFMPEDCQDRSTLPCSTAFAASTAIGREIVLSGMQSLSSLYTYPPSITIHRVPGAHSQGVCVCLDLLLVELRFYKIPLPWQVLFFSATYPDEVREWASKLAPGATAIQALLPF